MVYLFFQVFGLVEKRSQKFVPLPTTNFLSFFRANLLFFKLMKEVASAQHYKKESRAKPRRGETK